MTQEVNLNPDKTLVYSAHNRLLEVIDDPTTSTIATYGYDALGQRVAKTTAAGVEQFVYGPNGELLAVLDGNGDLLHEYVYLGGTAIIDLGAEPSGAPPGLPPEVLVDNDSAVVGGANWQSKSSSAAVNGTYLQNRKLPGRTVVWYVDGDLNFQGGFYDVYVKWLAQDGVQTTYELHVWDGQGGSQGYLIDVPHAGLSVGDWAHLGTFEFQDRAQGPFQHVALYGDNNTSGLLGTFLSADAMRAVPLASPLDRVDLKFMHHDHLGTPHAVTDEAGTVIWTASYLPFGKATVDEDPDGDLENYELSFRFPGQYEDAETGLHYNYFRDYDPGIGRYIESDPIGLNGGPNTYGYAYQNPIGLIDLSGQTVVIPFPHPIIVIPIAVCILSDICADAGRAIDEFIQECMEDVDEDPKECSKATKWQLIQAGIGDEHEYKTEWGAVPNSRFDICACKDGSIVIKAVGQCGKFGFTIPTTERWK